jgi:hypothetical protein
MENTAMPLRPGRPLTPHLRAEWKLSLHAAVAAEVDLLLEDPLTRKPKYGARSRLIEALLDNWLSQQRGGSSKPIPNREELTINA